jgi:hypothetical protein
LASLAITALRRYRHCRLTLGLRFAVVEPPTWSHLPRSARRLLTVVAVAAGLTAWRNTMLAINERRYGSQLLDGPQGRHK